MAKQKLTDEQALAEIGGASSPAMSDDHALKEIATGQPQSHLSSSTSGAFARNAGQGATAGFYDELTGLADASMRKIGGLSDKPFMDLYREARDKSRAQFKEDSREHPVASVAGNLAGGVVGAVALPIAKAPVTIAKGIATGAAWGAAGGLGGSEGDLTKPSTQNVSRAALDTTVGGAVGGTIGGALAALSTPVKAIIASRRGISAAAENIAKDAAQTSGRLEGVGLKTSQAKFFDQTQDLAAKWSKAIGEPVQFTPSQETASRSLALKELAARHNPATIDTAQAFEAKQLEQSSKILDHIVSSIAPNPSALGKGKTAETVTGALERHIQGLIDQRSKNIGPLFDEAARLSGSKQFVPISSGIKDLQSLVSDNELGPTKALARKVSGTIDDIVKRTSKDGKTDLGTVRQLLSSWSAVQRGDVNLIEGLPTRAQGRIAGKVMDALNVMLDGAQADEVGPAAKTLISARQGWKEYSRPIKEAATDMVETILGVSKEAGDTIPARIMRASPGEIEGVFKVLRKADPDAAKQLFAESFNNLLVESGKAVPGSVVAEEGVVRLKPGEALAALTDPKRGNSERLIAMAGGDGRLINAYRESLQLLKRLNFGPNIKGASTEPQLAQEAANAGKSIGALFDKNSEKLPGYSGIALRKLGKTIEEWLGNVETMAEVYHSPEGIELFNKSLRALRDSAPVTSKTLTAVAAFSDKMGQRIGKIGQDDK